MPKNCVPALLQELILGFVCLQGRGGGHPHASHLCVDEHNHCEKKLDDRNNVDGISTVSAEGVGFCPSTASFIVQKGKHNQLQMFKNR